MKKFLVDSWLVRANLVRNITIIPNYPILKKEKKKLRGKYKPTSAGQLDTKP
jgi:hypothetical protein